MEWKFLPEDKSGPARKSRDYRLFNERVIKSAQLLEKSLSEYIVREDEDLNTNKLLKETSEPTRRNILTGSSNGSSTM